jgi:hypothetical protein
LHRRTDQRDLDMVRADLHVNTHSNDPVPVHLAALGAQRSGRLVDGSVVGIGGK